jgi:hypothetical protein
MQISWEESKKLVVFFPIDDFSIQEKKGLEES